MAGGVQPIDRIIPGIGVAVDVDAWQHRIVAVGGQEPSQHRVVVAGVEILQAGLGVVLLVDPALAGKRQADGLAEGAVVMGGGGGVRHIAHQAAGAQVVAMGPGGGGVHPLEARREAGGEQARGVGGVDQQFGVMAHVICIGRAEALGGALAVEAIGEARGIGVLGDGQGGGFAIIEEGARQDGGTRPVGIIGQRIARRVIAHRHPADAAGPVGMARTGPLGGIGNVASGAAMRIEFLDCTPSPSFVTPILRRSSAPEG